MAQLNSRSNSQVYERCYRISGGQRVDEPLFRAIPVLHLCAIVFRPTGFFILMAHIFCCLLALGDDNLILKEEIQAGWAKNADTASGGFSFKTIEKCDVDHGEPRTSVLTIKNHVDQSNALYCVLPYEEKNQVGGQAYGRNRDYLFCVEPVRGRQWNLFSVIPNTPTDQKQQPEDFQRLNLYARYISRYYFSLDNNYDLFLNDIFEDPRVVDIQLRLDHMSGNSLVVLTFDCNKGNFWESFVVTLDSKVNYLPTRINSQRRMSKQGPVEATQFIEYLEFSKINDGWFPRRKNFELKASEATRFRYSSEFTEISVGAQPKEVFRLSQFGLPEPEFPRRNYSLWLVLALIGLALVIAVAITKSRQKAN